MSQKTNQSTEIEEDKGEIVPILQASDFTTREGASPLYASNVSCNPVLYRGDVEIGSLQQDPSSVNAEEKCEVAATQLNSSHVTPPNASMNTSNADPDDTSI